LTDCDAGAGPELRSIFSIHCCDQDPLVLALM